MGVQRSTLPENDIAPEIQWFGMSYFQGRTVSFRECNLSLYHLFKDGLPRFSIQLGWSVKGSLSEQWLGYLQWPSPLCCAGIRPRWITPWYPESWILPHWYGHKRKLPSKRASRTWLPGHCTNGWLHPSNIWFLEELFATGLNAQGRIDFA